MQKLTIAWTSRVGIAHEEVITGPRIIGGIHDGTAVIRVLSRKGKVRSVHTRTGVDSIDWLPG